MRKLKRNSKKNSFFSDISGLIEDGRSSLVKVVNTTLPALYWNIGKRINEHILKNKKPAYGEEVITKLSSYLIKRHGDGWGEKHLRHCLRTAETFSENQIVSALRRQLTWTHIRAITYLKDDIQREFYLEMCVHERWTTRELQDKIDSMLYERTAISKKPAKLIKQEIKKLKTTKTITPDLVFRDPYVLNFLGLKDVYSEKDLESAIIAELQRFITELGNGFAFVARQKRIIIDDDDFCSDLLFFNRKFKCLVAIELKLGKFKAEYKSKMELYLTWLTKYEMQPGEKKPVGLILCTEGSKEQIELLELHRSGIKVAEYMTELPSRTVLKRKLQQALVSSKKLLEARKDK